MGEHRAYLAEVERLSERLRAVQPDEYRVWFRAVAAADHAESEWRRTRAAVLAHVQAWKTVFSHCNVEPVPGLGQD